MMDQQIKLNARGGGLILATAMVCAITSQAWAEKTLEGIELNASAAQTRVILKTQIRVPYYVVSSDNEKIVIDLRVPDPSKIIHTDFTSADNIDQVVLKPIASDKLRMVIRGENLGRPYVGAELPDGVRRGNSQKVVFQGESAKAGGTAMMAIAKANPEAYAMTALAQPSNNVLVPEPAAGAFEDTPIDTGAGASAPEQKTQMMDNEQLDPDKAPIPSNEKKRDRGVIAKSTNFDEISGKDDGEYGLQDQILDQLGQFASVLGRFWKTMPQKTLLKAFAFGGVLLFAATIILQRMFRDDGELLPNGERKPSRLFAFWNGVKRRRPKSKKRGGSRLRRGNTFAGEPDEYLHEAAPYRGGDRPVGLKGLTEDTHKNYPLPLDTGEIPIISPKHALSQYAKNAAALPMPDVLPRDSQEIDRELKRSLYARQAIEQTHTRKQPFKQALSEKSLSSNRKPAAKAPVPAPAPAPQKPAVRPDIKRPSMKQHLRQDPPNALSQTKRTGKNQEAGLPANNNEVLDFLRNVAELMEKDGSPELARGVKRGMSPRKP